MFYSRLYKQTYLLEVIYSLYRWNSFFIDSFSVGVPLIVLVSRSDKLLLINLDVFERT